MKRIGLLSDTHGFLDDRIFKYFNECDEIWHAGDIGSIQVVDRLSTFKSFKAVYGNIDDYITKKSFPEILRFSCENVRVLIKHIGGYPGKYDKSIINELEVDPPDLLIVGHSHLLKIQYDKQYNFLYINPGAAGNYGIHKVKTIIRFTVDDKDIKDLEIIELK